MYCNGMNIDYHSLVIKQVGKCYLGLKRLTASNGKYFRSKIIGLFGRKVSQLILDS